MARLAPKLDVIRTLFGLSRNQCAFPKCEQALFNHRNQFIAQICHIEAALPGGERFNPESTDEDRRDFNNLIILCYPHHIETNDEKKFTVEVLREIKTSHESQNSEARLAINDEKLIEINNYIKRNWLQIDYANKHQHLYREYGFAVDINIDLDFTELSKILEDLICQLDISSSELRQSLTSDVSFQSSKNGQIEFGRLQSIHFWETVCLF